MKDLFIINKKYLLIVLFSLLNVLGYSQLLIPVVGGGAPPPDFPIEEEDGIHVTINGPGNVDYNSYATYEVSIDGLPELLPYTVSYSVYGGQLGFQFSNLIQVQWTSATSFYFDTEISASVNILGNYYVARKYVYVNDPIPPVPAAPVSVYTNNCEQIQISKGTLTADTEITSYWQGTNSNGTSTANSSYYYTVPGPGRYYLRAQNSSGVWSTSSSSIYVPFAPSNVSSSEQTASSITLNWSGVQGNETGFVISRAVIGEGYSVIATTSGSARSYVDTGLVNGEKYFYTIQAKVGSALSRGSCYIEIETAGSIPTNEVLEHEPQYNGNISAIKWKAHGDAKEKLYSYHYDPLNRITSAQYAENLTANVWTQKKGAFQVHGISYDLNGNIKSLSRQGLQEGTTSVIDQLSYGYQGNRLQYVEDEANDVGFKNGHIGNMGNPDYTYDHNGNMTKDLNKEISTITYNYLNLPERVTKSDGSYLEYTYDAAGVKLSQRVYNTSSELVKTTDYIGELIYEDGELQLIQHEEGRIVPDETAGEFEYQYHLKDHLGNTRLTFTSKPKEIEFDLNYESNGNDDMDLFQETDNIVNADIHDYVHPNESGSHTKTQRLTGAANSQVGSVIAIPVGAGDKVSAQVFAKYLPTNNTTNPTAAIASFITSAFTGGTGVTSELTSQSISNGFGGGSLITNPANGYSYDGAGVMAFLNILFLPEEATASIATDQFAFNQLNSSATSHERLFIDDFEAPKAGYVLVYLTNEDPTFTEVYFDDLKITVNEHPVIQTDNYYPFGLTHSTGYQRVTAQKNDFKYNGKELIEDLGLDWYDYGARMYMADIGRWNGVDALADEYAPISPYIYVANDPIKLIDPDGKQIWVSYDVTDDDGNVTTHSLQYKDDGKLYDVDGNEYNGNDEFVLETLESINYLVDGGTGNIEGTDINIIEELTNSENSVVIIEKGFIILDFGHDKGSVSYRPEAGVETEEGGLQTPALGLLHELGHAYDYLLDNKNYTKRRSQSDEKFDNKEEKYVVEKIENPAAKKLGEAQRSSHGGKPYETTGPTTTKRKRKKKNNP